MNWWIKWANIWKSHEQWSLVWNMLAYVQNMFLHFFFVSHWKWAEFYVRSIFMCTRYDYTWYVVWFGVVYKVQSTVSVVYIGTREASKWNAFVLCVAAAVCHLYAMCALIQRYISSKWAWFMLYIAFFKCKNWFGFVCISQLWSVMIWMFRIELVLFIKNLEKNCVVFLFSNGRTNPF